MKAGFLDIQLSILWHCSEERANFLKFWVTLGHFGYLWVPQKKRKKFACIIFSPMTFSQQPKGLKTVFYGIVVKKEPIL